MTSNYFTAERGGMDLSRNYYGAGSVDPGWDFVTRSDKGRGKSRQYTLMPVDEICALPIGELFLPNAAIVLWNTQIANAKGWHTRALEAWGFTPQCSGAWKKLTSKNSKPFFGTGFILRSCAEFYTVGTRGKCSPLAKNIRNFIEAHWRGESVKPDELQHDIEALYPGPYVELFARRHYPGWDCWGNELIPEEEPSSLLLPGKPGLVEPYSARSRLIIHVDMAEGGRDAQKR
jgi:N6-adenosine-specific RNA methylase IME4